MFMTRAVLIGLKSCLAQMRGYAISEGEHID